MRLQETIGFYLLLGMGVAVAMLLTAERRTGAGRSFLVFTATLFWPLYLPLLLARPTATRPAAPDDPPEPRDEMAAAIAQVNVELDAALSSLDGWAESVLQSEKGRLSELRAALVAHAARIRAMDGLLAGPDAADGAAAAPLAATALPGGESGDRWRQSETARLQNIARLAAVRRQSYADLMATLAWIRELVSMIHLAKFTGAPASRAEELVAQIAAAVEGISAVAAGQPTERAAAADGAPSCRTLQPADQTFPRHSGNHRSNDTWASSNAPAT